MCCQFPNSVITQRAACDADADGRPQRAMIAAQRDAFVADAERDAVGLISREIETMQAYFSTLGTQAALLGGFAFSLVSSDFDGLIAASTSCSLLMITVVYSSVVGSRAATMGLTGAKPSAIRHTVVLMRQDQRYVEFSFYAGIVTFMIALCWDIALRDIETGPGWNHIAWRVASVAILAVLGCIGTLCAAHRGYQRYRSYIARHDVVSGDEFVKIRHKEGMHAEAEGAIKEADRALARVSRDVHAT